MTNNILNKKSLFATLLLLLALNACFAKKVPGYIITNNADTLFGKIKISLFDPYSGRIVFHGINLEPFYKMVRFEDSYGTYKIYEPVDIIEFGFMNDSIEYRFVKFEIGSKSLVKTDRIGFKFLNLVYQGEFSIYRDFVRMSNHKERDYYNSEECTQYYYRYYLYSEDKGLKRIEKTKEFKKLVDLLSYYELDKEFLEQLPEKAKFKKALKVLKECRNWKIQKTNNTLNI